MNIDHPYYKNYIKTMIIYLLNKNNRIVYRKLNNVVYYNEFDGEFDGMRTIINDIVKYGITVDHIGLFAFTKTYNIVCHEEYISGIFINDINEKCVIAMHPAHTFKAHIINYIFEFTRYKYSLYENKCKQELYDYEKTPLHIIRINICKICKRKNCNIFINGNKQDICNDCNKDVSLYMISKYKLKTLLVFNIDGIVKDIQMNIIRLFMFI